MSIGIVEISSGQIEGLNRSLIGFYNQNNPGSTHVHQLVNAGGLQSCVGAIFYQSFNGYQHLPIEKMAGLLLYRVAQGQYFLDGNKRTAITTAFTFMRNNGYRLLTDRDTTRDLLWGFAQDTGNGQMKYNLDDAIKFIEDNSLPMM